MGGESVSLFFTITGQKHYYGMLPFSVGMSLTLRAEPDNLYDSRAVAVYATPYGKVGMVANTPDTAAEGTVLASALFPQIQGEATAIVRFIAGEYILAQWIE